MPYAETIAFHPVILSLVYGEGWVVGLLEYSIEYGWSAQQGGAANIAHSCAAGATLRCAQAVSSLTYERYSLALGRATPPPVRCFSANTDIEVLAG